MTHIPPFDAIRRALEISTQHGELRVATSYETFLGIIKQFVSAIPVDEAWYLETYPDIADAVAAGVLPSGRQHYIEDGYFEGRLPYAPEVDEDWYLNAYPDVGDGVSAGRIGSATQHFIRDGYREGRRAHA